MARLANTTQKRKFLNGIDSFIDRIGDVSRMCSEEMISRSVGEGLAISLHNDYIIWKLDFFDYLQKHELYFDAKNFRIENEVPYLKGGLDYTDKDSKKSRILIEAIGKEIKEKLAHIRQIHEKVSSEIKEGENKDIRPTITFNTSTGELRRLNYKCKPVFFTEKRKLLITTLIENRDVDGGFVKTNNLASQSKYANTKQCRDSIYEIKKRVYGKLSILDFIVGEEDVGYKITDEINIILDTP